MRLPAVEAGLEEGDPVRLDVRLMMANTQPAVENLYFLVDSREHPSLATLPLAEEPATGEQAEHPNATNRSRAPEPTNTTEETGDENASLERTQADDGEDARLVGLPPIGPILGFALAAALATRDRSTADEG